MQFISNPDTTGLKIAKFIVAVTRIVSFLMLVLMSISLIMNFDKEGIVVQFFGGLAGLIILNTGMYLLKAILEGDKSDIDHSS